MVLIWNTPFDGDFGMFGETALVFLSVVCNGSFVDPALLFLFLRSLELLGFEVSLVLSISFTRSGSFGASTGISISFNSMVDEFPSINRPSAALCSGDSPIP